jgi:hypothetical protein
MNHVLFFLTGLAVGTLIGITIMCILQGCER